ncbi:MAG: hypothetical protein KIT87_16470 [Anaerolineae bacterium]|nr:hypothetical protein [Anaerolineae bacterium]
MRLTRLLTPVLLFLALWLVLGPAAAHAQGLDWQEKRTTHFAIIYVPQQADEADRYAGFVDGVYDDLSKVFGLAIQTPVSLRLFPDDRSYIAVNPLAEKVPGVIAHATSGRGRREIAIAVQRTRDLSEASIVNNVRHELTHLIIAQMAGDNLPVGFHEGVAQYLEKPIPQEQQQIVRRLRQAVLSNNLMSWSDLNAPGGAYSNPDIAYPESLSIVAFLVDRYGFGKLIEFFKAQSSSAGYRSALEMAYGVSADQLEAQWREYLPQYIESRYAINALYAYDLSQARTLLGQGAYTAAKEELERAVYLLRNTGQTERLTEAETMLAQAELGIAAGATVLDARKAIEGHDYAQTRALVAKAREQYATLRDTRRADELREYERRAVDALVALDQLKQAETLTRSYRYPEARAVVAEAAQTLGELGDTPALAIGQGLLVEMEQRQRQVAYSFLGLGGLVLLLNMRRRWTTPDPQQGWQL